MAFAIPGYPESNINNDPYGQNMGIAPDAGINRGIDYGAGAGMPVQDPYANGYAPYGVDQNYAYGAQQLQMPVQAPMGRIDRYGMVHYTKSQYVDGVRAYVMQATGLAISSDEAIDEAPQLLRHACAPAKISYLPICYFNVPETGVRVPFYFCTACGKLFHVKDFM